MKNGDTIKHNQTDKEFEVMNITNNCVTLKDEKGVFHYITPRGAAEYFNIINKPSHVQA